MHFISDVTESLVVINLSKYTQVRQYFCWFPFIQLLGIDEKLHFVNNQLLFPSLTMPHYFFYKVFINIYLLGSKQANLFSDQNSFDIEELFFRVIYRLMFCKWLFVINRIKSSVFNINNLLCSLIKIRMIYYLTRHFLLRRKYSL